MALVVLTGQRCNVLFSTRPFALFVHYLTCDFAANWGKWSVLHGDEAINFGVKR